MVDSDAGNVYRFGRKCAETMEWARTGKDELGVAGDAHLGQHSISVHEPRLEIERSSRLRAAIWSPTSTTRADEDDGSRYPVAREKSRALLRAARHRPRRALGGADADVASHYARRTPQPRASKRVARAALTPARAKHSLSICRRLRHG